MKIEYEVGQRCTIANGGDEREEGVIVHKFILPAWYDPVHYVVEIETAMDPMLYCRQALTMRPVESAKLSNTR